MSKVSSFVPLASASQNEMVLACQLLLVRHAGLVMGHLCVLTSVCPLRDPQLLKSYNEGLAQYRLGSNPSLFTDQLCYLGQMIYSSSPHFSFIR